jgi:hypothetical protein
LTRKSRGFGFITFRYYGDANRFKGRVQDKSDFWLDGVKVHAYFTLHFPDGEQLLVLCQVNVECAKPRAQLKGDRELNKSVRV